MNYHDLLPELKHEHGEIFKPGLASILLYHSDKAVWTKLVFSLDSGIESEEFDLSFIVDGKEILFKVEYDLEANARQFMNLDNKSLLMTIGHAFSEEGGRENTQQFLKGDYK